MAEGTVNDKAWRQEGAGMSGKQRKGLDNGGSWSRQFFGSHWKIVSNEA